MTITDGHRTMCTFLQRILEIASQRLNERTNERTNEWTNEIEGNCSNEIDKQTVLNTEDLTEIDWPNNAPAQCSYPITIIIYLFYWNRFDWYVLSHNNNKTSKLTVLHIFFRAIALDYDCNWHEAAVWVLTNNARAISTI